MPNPAVLMAGAGAGSSLLGARSQARAATSAQNAQIAASERSVAAIRELMAPWVQSGQRAQTSQGNLAGINGPAAQRRAIAAISGGREMQALTQQGENSILQNAAATGGLRGGNTQGALAQFRPAMLNQLIQQQLGQLGGISQTGVNAAAGVSSQVSDQYGQQGAALAGGALARGQATQTLLGNLNQGLGNFMAYRPAQPQGAGMFQRWGF